MVFSCGLDSRVKAWSIPNKKLKYEINHSDEVYDIVIGQDGTQLENRIVSFDINHFGGEFCLKISNLETGVEVKRINLGSASLTIAVDQAQTVIVLGTKNKMTFIETTNFTIVKEVPFESVYFVLDHSLATCFNKRNDGMLTLTGVGGVYSIKF